MLLRVLKHNFQTAVSHVLSIMDTVTLASGISPTTGITCLMRTHKSTGCSFAAGGKCEASEANLYEQSREYDTMCFSTAILTNSIQHRCAKPRVKLWGFSVRMKIRMRWTNVHWLTSGVMPTQIAHYGGKMEGTITTSSNGLVVTSKLLLY